MLNMQQLQLKADLGPLVIITQQQCLTKKQSLEQP